VGVKVIQGATVLADSSTFSSEGNLLLYKVGGKEYRVRASLVVDASGPTGVLSSHFGLRTSEGIPFQTGSVWTYYSQLKPLAEYSGWKGKAEFPRDQYTQHLCFREGWLWYIPLVSWQSAPTANLQRALEKMLRGGRRGVVPSRAELSEEFACPHHAITSVGISLRSDRDRWLKEDPWEAFQHYAKKYPTIGKLLEGGQRLENYYGVGQTHMSRLNIRSYARQVAGDGWLLIGDAAFFVDPLISPGLTGGTAGAFMAAQATAKALDSGVFARDYFAEYQAFISRLHEALERDNQLVYMSFNHPEALALIQRFQEIYARRHFLENRNREYDAEDTNVWGVLDSMYQELQKAAWTILREAEEEVGRELSVQEQSTKDYEPAVRKLRHLLSEYLDSHTDLTPYAKLNLRNAGRVVA